MKTKLHIIIGLFFLSTVGVKGQITLEHTLDSTGIPSFYLTYIDDNEAKYVFQDIETNSFSLYNMDMSPFLTNVHIPVVQDSLIQGFKVIYISRKLFDCDSSNIEYVYESPYDVLHKFRVFRIDGTLLFEVDSANGPYASLGGFGGAQTFRPIQATPTGTKLFLQKYGPNNVPQMLIYNLCGPLPVNSFDFSEQNELLVNIYPNPTTQELNFDISKPNNQDDFQIIIYDGNGKMQSKQTLLQQGKLTINVEDYTNGVYMYSLVGKSKTYQSGKFILKK